MIKNLSICLYHNGNSRILDYYKDKFSNLIFSGNWAEAADKPNIGHLWEICFADATQQNMIDARSRGIFILRHISTYNDDLANRVSEASEFRYIDWLNHAVSHNLCFADKVVSDLYIPATRVSDDTAIITTGRSANTHLQLALSDHGIKSFEYLKIIDQRFLDAKSAVLLWRENHWDCMTSIWIAQQINSCYHQTQDQKLEIPKFTVDQIDTEWIAGDWATICQTVFDHAMLFKYVCQRSIFSMTTENIVGKFQTQQKKIIYDKEKIINNYAQSLAQYQQSQVA